ncbi:hypothetical protein R3P38DRAFT_3256587 [Favolaschia claudopus]|uniref:Uncharacterized protein n=1 Tax=Favolaschia claudopus TaxID=2862362 RepID=A0AAW0DGI1_9AGAR
MTHPNSNDLLVSVADAALTAAEVDAAKPNSSLIFREEWRPTPRTRSSPNQPRRPPISENRSFAAILKSQAAEVAGGISRVISPGPEQHRPAVQPLVRSTSAPISGPPPAAPDSASHPSIRGSASSVSESAATSPSAPPASATVSPSPQARPNLEEGAVGEILRENREDYEEVINHAFPRAMGDGTASLDGFRYYMLVDRLYS